MLVSVNGHIIFNVHGKLIFVVIVKMKPHHLYVPPCYVFVSPEMIFVKTVLAIDISGY